MFIPYKKLISAFLTVVIIFLLIPHINAEDSDIQISSHAELSEFLNNSDSGTKAILCDDIVVNIEEETVAYIYNVNRTVTLNLNGKSIKVTNSSNLSSKCNDSTLFYINTDCVFTVNDSSAKKTGRIEYVGAIIPNPTHSNKNPISAVMSVDAFFVDSGASLILNDVTVSAGNHENQWLHNAISISDGGFKYDSGVTTQVICGNVVTVNNGAELIINGGRYTSHGRSRGNSLPNVKGWDEEKPASVCVRALEGSKVLVNDGCFYGNYGADVFELHSNSDSLIKSGSFVTSPVVNERAADYEGRHSYISGEYCGSIELPLWAVPAVSRMSFYKNNNKLDTSNMPVIRESEGQTIVLKPSSNLPASLRSEGIITSYSIGNSAYIHADYTPYFDNGSKISYEWYVHLPDSTQKTLSFKGETLNLQLLSNSDEINFESATEYEFGCIITEEYKLTNSYVLTSFSNTFKITTSNKKVIPSISLTPSEINSRNEYRSGSIPSFSASKNANYDISSVNWYSLESSTYENVTELFENSDYQIVFELSAKNGYHFSTDSQVSFLPGGENITVVPSNDGTTAKIYAVLRTECTHKSTRTIYDHVKHWVTCNVCGDILLSEPHRFSQWANIDDQTNEQTRSCLVCHHSESALLPQESTDNIEFIPAVTIDFGQIYYNVSPKDNVPKLYDTPLSKHVTIIDHSWTDVNGNPFTRFEFDKKYVLTVELSLSDPEAFNFTSDLKVLSLYNSTVSVTVSEDGTTATAIFTAYTLKEVVSNLTLPKVAVGSKIVSVLPKTPLSYFTLIWAENGRLIGSYDFINGQASNITDLNEDDGTDFSAYTFKNGAIYTLYVDWDTYTDSLVIYEGKGNVRLDISNAVEYSFLKGFKGTLIAKYDMRTKQNYIPVISVNGITPPDTNTTPDKTANSTNANYKVTSVTWTLNDSSFDSFSCLNRYTVHVTVKLNSGYKFSTDQLSAAVNGREADITINGNQAVISFTFAPIAHHISKDRNIINPDCALDGSITAICSACGYMNSLTVKKTPHALTYRCDKNATCSATGHSSHYFCIDCNSYYTDIDGNCISIDDIITSNSDHASISNCFDNKHHYSVCTFCYDITDDKAEHTFSEAMPLPDGTAYKACPCGYTFYFTPVFDEQTGESDLNPQNPNNIPLEKLKILIIAAIAFLLIVFFLILTISAYLLITRRSYKELLLQISESSDTTNDSAEE